MFLMKAKKIAVGLLSIVTVLFILLLCTFLFWLGPTVKLVAEQVGSKALGTPLTIHELTINPRSGVIHLSDFSIANPETYGRSNAVSLANLDVSIDMGSIFTRTVVVHKVSINSPYFIYEQSAATDNIQDFILNIQEFVGYDPSAPPPPADPREEEEKRRKREEKQNGPKVVIVESLVINDGQMHLANTDDPHLDIDISFDAFALSMTNGTVNLKNLRVSNPPLLDTPDLFTLDALDIAVDPASIYSGRVAILDVQIVRPYAYLEHNPKADTVSAFMKITERLTARANSPASPKLEAPEESVAEESMTSAPPFELHNLMADDIQIKLLDTTVTNASPDPRLLAGIDSVSVRLVDGTMQIKEVTVPCPDGFAASNFFHLANIDITLEPGSVFSPQTAIQQIFVNTPTINLEQTETTGNAAELKNTLMGFVPPAGAAKGAPTPQAAPQTGARTEPIPLSEKAVVLHTLVVTNFAVNLYLPADTNTPASESRYVLLDGAMKKVSLSKLHPFQQTATNDVAVAVESAAGGAMKLISFEALVAQPLQGTARITHLKVANPKGFANEHLVTVEQYTMELDPDSLQADTLLIRDILIHKPRVAYERKISTDNIKALQAEIGKAIERRKDFSEQEKPQTDAESPFGEAGARKVIIEHLLVDAGIVRAKLSTLPSAPIPLPNIEMKDMGKDAGGTSLRDAVSNIGVAFYDAIIGSVSSATGFAADALKGAGALTVGTLGSFTDRSGAKGHEQAETDTTAVSPQEYTPELPAPEKERRGRLFRRRTGRFF